MDMKNAYVLVTGGTEGIGRALAERYIKAGAKVLVTGRNKDRLEKAAAGLHGLHILQNDVGIARERETLAASVKKTMPSLNILINNAGIQRRISLAEDNAPWPERQAEIDILLSAPIHLNHLLIPLLLEDGRDSLIINVTSGGAYVPQVFAPVYSACKAALHSYTMVLRHSLANTGCRVVELIPPAVQTSLAGTSMAHGAPLDEFADKVFGGLAAGKETEIGYGPTGNLQPTVAGKPLDGLFAQNAARFPVKTYG